MVSDGNQFDCRTHIGDAEVGAIGKEALVFDACHRAGEGTGLNHRHLFASDGALGAGNHLDFVVLVEVFSADQFRVLKNAFLEVAGRQYAKFIGVEQTSGGAVDPVFFGIFALRALGNIVGKLVEGLRVKNFHAVRAANRNCLEFLVSPNHPVTGAARLTAIVRDVGIAYEVFAARTNGAGTDLIVAKFFADSFFSFEGAFTKKIGRIIELDAFIVNE